jgi:hypothetical protein
MFSLDLEGGFLCSFAQRQNAQVGPKSGVKNHKKSQKFAKIYKNLQKSAEIHHF